MQLLLIFINEMFEVIFTLKFRKVILERLNVELLFLIYNVYIFLEHTMKRTGQIYLVHCIESHCLSS